MMVNNFNNPQASLSYTAYGITTKTVFPSSDVQLEDLLQAFYACCVGATFNARGVLEGMKEFAESGLEVLSDNVTTYNPENASRTDEVKAIND